MPAVARPCSHRAAKKRTRRSGPHHAAKPRTHCSLSSRLRCYLFLLRLGVDEKRLRFRQHLEKEMAHYAEDCWDAEIECSYGWIECVGMADRSAYDLNAHASKSKVDLTAFEKYPEPRQEEVVEVTVNKQLVGKEFKKLAKAVQEALEALKGEDALAFAAKLAAEGSACLSGIEGETVTVQAAMVKIEKVTKTVNGRAFTPGVIEPSFGIGRILYCLLEHCFYWRPEDEQRLVLRLNPLVAPIKATVFPLMVDDRFMGPVHKIAQELTSAGIYNKVDATGVSIGKRYARTDELGVPFAVTVDHRTTEDGTVTLRERDSTTQVRGRRGAGLGAAQRQGGRARVHVWLRAWLRREQDVSLRCDTSRRLRRAVGSFFRLRAHTGACAGCGDQGGDEGPVRGGGDLGERRRQVPEAGRGGGQGVGGRNKREQCARAARCSCCLQPLPPPASQPPSGRKKQPPASPPPAAVAGRWWPRRLPRGKRRIRESGCFPPAVARHSGRHRRRRAGQHVLHAASRRLLGARPCALLDAQHHGGITDKPTKCCSVFISMQRPRLLEPSGVWC